MWVALTLLPGPIHDCPDPSSLLALEGLDIRLGEWTAKYSLHHDVIVREIYKNVLNPTSHPCVGGWRTLDLDVYVD